MRELTVELSSLTFLQMAPRAMGWLRLLGSLKLLSFHLAFLQIAPRDAGWLQLVGSLKLQVSFAKEPYKRDDILQKRPMILKNYYL